MTSRTGRVVALAGLVLAAAVSLAHASAPGANGRIAYMLKDGAGHWQVWVANKRLGGAKRLTSEDADSGYPAWSPDGRTIVFDSTRTDPNPDDANVVNDVFAMRPDGSGVAMLTDAKGASADPAWSPDGSLIAFDSDHGDYPSQQGIYMMNAQGGDVRRVTTLPPSAAYDLQPRFSPDGTRLVFTRYRGKGRSETAALFVVSVDGTHLRRLTTFAIHAGEADWSPDGRRIVFEAYPDPDAYGDVYMVGANGRNLRNLTRNPKGKAGSADPVWSPNGRTILFLDNRIVRDKPRTGLATMRPDGTARRFVSRKNAEHHQPDWESVR